MCVIILYTLIEREDTRLKAIVELDYSKHNNGGPISLLSIQILNSKEEDVTKKYSCNWIFGYNYTDKTTLKKDINKLCRTRIFKVEFV